MPLPTALRLPLGLCAVLVLACCSTASSSSPPSSSTPVPGVSMTDVGVFVVTSTDFVDGGVLDLTHHAAAWGQCSGDNLNPQLAWDGVPSGTASFAITMRDLSAGDWSHWVHANIPADVTSVGTGQSDSLPGTPGRNAASTLGYFGPCPPGSNHRYEVTVWALDTILDLPDKPSLSDFLRVADGHILTQGSILGVASPVD